MVMLGVAWRAHQRTPRPTRERGNTWIQRDKHTTQLLSLETVRERDRESERARGREEGREWGRERERERESARDGIRERKATINICQRK